MQRFSCITITATLGLLLTAQGALAVRGVKSLQFAHGYSMCLPDQAYPCDKNAGLGESNVIYVHQTEIDGQYVFESLEVPGVPDGKMWVAANYGAECKFGFHVDDARIRTGVWHDSGNGNDPMMVHPSWTSHPIGHSGGKKIWNDLIDLQFPIAPAFDAGVIDHFKSAEEVFAYGEARIADRVASGQTEEAARGAPFELQDWIATHAYVRCEGNVFGSIGWMSKAKWLPLKFVFVGRGTKAELQPTNPMPETPIDELTTDVAITQAFLYVEPDANDSCRLRLTGAFTTNGPTDISYRFVDELGHTSQMFTTTVDQTFASMIDHYVDLPVVEYPDGEIDGLVTEQRPNFDGELTAASTDREQGFYQIEVLEPYGYWSNVADFNVEPCRPEWTIADGIISGAAR